MFSECRENFAIKLDMFCFERVYEFTVRDAISACARVYFDAPQRAAHTLFLAVVIEAVYTRVQQSLPSQPLF